MMNHFNAKVKKNRDGNAIWIKTYGHGMKKNTENSKIDNLQFLLPEAYYTTVYVRWKPGDLLSNQIFFILICPMVQKYDLRLSNVSICK